MVTGLSKPLDHNEPLEFESDNETAEVEIDLELYMQEKLTSVIDREIISKISFKSRTTKNVTSIVKKELAIFEGEGKHVSNLQSCYANLNSILPSSEEPERVFQDVEEVLPKLDHPLHDESVDMLTFMMRLIKLHTKITYFLNLK
jgi:hypothetical protein